MTASPPPDRHVPVRITSFAVWQTLVTEASDFGGEVKGRRFDYIHRAVSKHRETSLLDVAAAYDRSAAELEHDWHLGVPIDNRRRVARIAQLLRVDLPAQDANELREHLESTHSEVGLRLLPDAVLCLRAAARVSNVIVISDSWMTPGRTMRSFLDDAGIGQYISAWFFSDETGLSKIGGAAFAAAWASLGAEPAHCVHVGDLVEADVAGARAAGVGEAVLVGFADHPVAPWPSGDRGDAVEVCGLAEAAAVIEGFHRRSR